MLSSPQERSLSDAAVQCLPELLRFAGDELEVDVERVERIADLMGHAGRQQRQGLDALAFDRLEGFLPGLGGVVQDEREPGTSLGIAIERRRVEADETGLRIGDLEFMPDNARAALDVQFAEPLPIQLRQELGDRFPVRAVRRKVEETHGALVEVEDPSGFIDHEDPVLDGVEEHLQERPLPRQPLQHGLHALRVQPPDPAEDAVKEAGLGSHGSIQNLK